MAWPTTFANLAGGNQPLSLFDTMFTQVAQMVAIPCTAAGQNAITLTPIGNAPTIPAYQNFSTFRFLAVATNNSLTTLQFAALAALPIYHADGVTQIGSGVAGELQTGQEYLVLFSQALNGGAGGFYLENAAVPTITATAGTSISGLRIANNAGNPDTRIDISCTEVVMASAGGSLIRAANVAITINMAVNGANGLDVGSQSAGGFYFLYLISNGSTTAGLASRSSTAPTLPGGYSFLKRVGAAPMDLGNAATSSVTITNASPGVVSWTAHGQPAGGPVIFTAGGGVLPAQIVGGTQYYVSPVGLVANAFQVTTGPLGASINTTGGSGTVTATAGAVRFRRFLQFGNKLQYVVAGAGTATAQLPVIAQANTTALGTYSTTAPVWQALAITGFVPTTASQIDLIVSPNSFTGSASPMQLAPNNSYGGLTATNGNIPWYDTGPTAANIDTLFVSHPGLMTLESTNIYWTASNAAATLSCAGWVDNI